MSKATKKPAAAIPDFSEFFKSDVEDLETSAFPETKTYFKYDVAMRQPQSPLVFCEAKIRGATNNTLVRIPDELLERLKYASGAKTVLLVALAEYALDELLKNGKSLRIANK